MIFTGRVGDGPAFFVRRPRNGIDRLIRGRIQDEADGRDTGRRSTIGLGVARILVSGRLAQGGLGGKSRLKPCSTK